MKFWIDKNKEDIELLYKIMAEKSRTQTIRQEQYLLDLEAVRVSIKALHDSTDVKAMADTRNRLDNLELWKAEMHRLLLETSPVTGKPKLTKTARFLKGRF